MELSTLTHTQKLIIPKNTPLRKKSNKNKHMAIIPLIQPLLANLTPPFLNRLTHPILVTTYFQKRLSNLHIYVNSILKKSCHIFALVAVIRYVQNVRFTEVIGIMKFRRQEKL